MSALLTDPVLGSWRRDVDDVLSIIMLKDIVKKIATTEGNGPAYLTYKTSLALKEKGMITATVHPSPKLKIANISNSVEALLESLQRGYDIVTIAPNTYLYEALKQASIERGGMLTIMGGSLRKRLLYILPEFNFWRDQKAAKYVVENYIWRTRLIVTIDTTMRVKWNCKNIIRYFDKMGLNWLSTGIRKWCITSKLLFGGFIPHDPITTYAYRCMIGKSASECDLDLTEKKVRVKKTRIVFDKNGVDALILNYTPKLHRQVMNELLYVIEQMR